MSEQYRRVYRRIIKLPLHQDGLHTLRTKVRERLRNKPEFKSNNAYIKKAISVMDKILLDEDYKSFPSLLDFIYKQKSPDWTAQLQNTKYSAFKQIWPQIHLIEEFSDLKSIRRYFAQLETSQPVHEFLLMDELNLTVDPTYPPLTPLTKTAVAKTEIDVTLEETMRFYKFLSKNFSMLLDLKLQPLEVAYEPNRFGLPHSVAARENVLKKKVNYIKELTWTFLPLEKHHLDKIIRYITSEESHNSNHLRFLRRKHEKEAKTISPYELKYLRQKNLIPNDRNIKFLYRDYIIRQFYVDEKGHYHMSPMKNLYD